MDTTGLRNLQDSETAESGPGAVQQALDRAKSAVAKQAKQATVANLKKMFSFSKDPSPNFER